jgi:hypothetical protein
LSIPDVAAYVSPTELLSFNVSTPTPYGGSGERYNALRLDWDDVSPLILTPQAGNAGYAIELVGQIATGSPIAWIFRTNNPYAGGRAFSTPNANDDFVLAITGQYVPEPSAFLLCGLCVTFVGAAFPNRKR